MTVNDINPALKEYRRLAPDYNQRWSSYTAASLEQTLRRIEFRSGEFILDVGCGTGVLLSRLSAADPTLFLSGVDPVQEMLEVARKRLGDGVVLKQRPAENLPFPSQSFDIVISTNAFHYFRKPIDALVEMARVLKQDGQIIITDWCGDYVISRAYDFFLRKFSASHYLTYDKKQLSSLLQQVGLTGVLIDSYKIDWFWGLMTASAKKRT